VTPTGREQTAENRGIHEGQLLGGADGGARQCELNPSCNSDTSAADPDLARMIAAWPRLPENIKAAIRAIVELHGE